MAVQVYFIGAGPGDPELLTIKGKEIIERADVIIYADSLIKPEVCGFAKSGAEIHRSASMSLEEITAIIENAVKQGKMVARVQSGDPSIYGAIQEQMVYMKRQKIAQFLGVLRDLGCTSLLTSEISSSEGEFYLEEFLADGVIRLEKTLRNFNLIKTVRIEKMRGVKYDEQPKRYVIDERGVYVYSTEPAVV